MMKKLLCGLNSKVWAMMMVCKNFTLGICIILGGSLWQRHNKVLKEALNSFNTYFTGGVILGVVNIIAGIVLILALIKGKENLVLLYILLEFIVLFILTIFTAMSTLNPDLWILFLCLFFLCLSLWIGLYNVYVFYLELQDYNNSSVLAGVGETYCYSCPNPMESFPEKALDATVL